MMVKAGRILATATAMSAGFIVLASYFSPNFVGLATLFLSWAIIALAFALFLGVVNLLRVNTNLIMTQLKTGQKGWFYSAILLLSLALTLIIGWQGPASAGGQAIFYYVLYPLEATLFALMAFFMAVAAYRAFRVRNFETFLMFIFAAVVLLGQVPAGFQLWSQLPLIKDWIMRAPAMAGARGILLGVALGTIATGLRLLLGLDRPYTDSE